MFCFQFFVNITIYIKSRYIFWSLSMISHCANNIDDFFSPAVCHLSSPFFWPLVWTVGKKLTFSFQLIKIVGWSFIQYRSNKLWLKLSRQQTVKLVGYSFIYKLSCPLKQLCHSSWPTPMSAILGLLANHSTFYSGELMQKLATGTTVPSWRMRRCRPLRAAAVIWYTGKPLSFARTRMHRVSLDHRLMVNSDSGCRC